MAGRSATDPSSFFITLPSNASLDSYPDNNPSNFTVDLNPALELNGNYECSLVEISLPRSWSNVLKSDDLFLNLSNTATKKTQKINLNRGHYGTVQYLITKLNAAVKPEFKQFSNPNPQTAGRAAFYFRHLFHWSTEIQKVFLAVPENVKLVLSDTLQRILGLERNNYEGPLQAYAANIANIHTNINAFYVYGSIIENRHVGDVRAPLLRIVPIDNQNGGCDIFHSFTNLQYSPVRLSHFDRITINIRSGRGELIPFQKGIVIVTLQFRRRLF